MPKLFGRTYTKRQLLDRVGDISQLIHARKGRTDEGFAQGADLIEVSNASGLTFTVLPGRAAHCLRFLQGTTPVTFRSSPGDVGPAFTTRAALSGFAAGLAAS